MTTEFSEANALTVLLTTESLLFASLSAGISLGPTGGSVRDIRLFGFQIQPRHLGWFIFAGILTVAAGAFSAWWGVFVNDWPSGVRREAQAIAIGVGIVAQPCFALAIASGLRFRS